MGWIWCCKLCADRGNKGIKGTKVIKGNRANKGSKANRGNRGNRATRADKRLLVSDLGYSGGCFDGVRGVKRGRGDDFCEEGLSVKRDVWWLKEGFEERFWRVFGGFLEGKRMVFYGFHGDVEG